MPLIVVAQRPHCAAQPSEA